MLAEREVVRLAMATWERFEKLRERNKKRHEHWHRMDSVKPKFDEDSGIDNDFQIHLLTGTHRKLKSRLGENHFTVQVEPLKKTQGNKGRGEMLERVLNPAFEIVEERLGYTIQDGLSDGQIKFCFGVLGWRRADETWPAVPEWEYLDELPDPDEEGIAEGVRTERLELRQRFEEEKYTHKREYRTEKRKTTKDYDGYKEKPESYLERVKQQRAQAGFPYHVTTYDPRTVAFIGDEAGGLAVFVTMQRVPLVKYREEQDGQKHDGKPIVIALSEHNDKIRVYRETGNTPLDSDPSFQYTSHVTVACLWTRDEWHEIATLGDAPVSINSESWTYVKGGKHTYGEPPFAIIAADEDTTEQLPELRYLPILHDMYDLKPATDKGVAVLLALAESIQLPDVLLEDTNPLLGGGMTEDGNPIEIGSNAASATSLPLGKKLVQIQREMSPAFVQSVNLLLEMIKEAAPPTGSVQIEAKTAPWTARQMTEEANVGPRKWLGNQVRGIRKCVRSIVQDMGRRDEPVWVFQKGEEIIGIDPKDIVGLNVDVAVETTSAGERITKEEHGRVLVNDAKIMLPLETYYEEYALVADPMGRVLDTYAWQAFSTLVLPQLMKQKMAERYGFEVVVGPGMSLVGMGGEELTSGRVLQSADSYSGMMGRVTEGARPQRTMPPLTDQHRPPNVMQQAPMMTNAGNGRGVV